MGKNKGQKTKSKEKAFTVIQAAKKSKTKEVKTNLKKVDRRRDSINFQTKSKTEKADERFKALQETVLDSTTRKTKKSEIKPKPRADVKEQSDTAVDMETATQSLAKL